MGHAQGAGAQGHHPGEAILVAAAQPLAQRGCCVIGGFRHQCVDRFLHGQVRARHQSEF